MRRFHNLLDGLDTAPDDLPFITSWASADDRERLSFAQFRRRAKGDADTLRRCGVSSGDRVVIIMPQGIPSMTTFVGAMMLGAIPAFLAYPNFKTEPSKYRSGLAGVTANLHATAVVIDEHFPNEMLSCISNGGEIKLIRAGARDGSVSKEAETQKDVSKIQPGHLAFIQHSAGTTGLQKGVALTHGAVLRQIESLAQTLNLDSATDRVYTWLPLYHDMGLIACFMLPLVCHIHVVMQSPMDWVMRPETMLQIIDDYKCTVAWMPNFGFQFVPRRTPQSRWAKYNLSSLRLLINCSEPVRASSMIEFQQAFKIGSTVLQSSYAMAENVFAVTQSEIAKTTGPQQIWVDGQQFRSAHRVVNVTETTPGVLSFTSSGRLLPNHEIRIVSDSGAILAQDFVGEIAVKSDCLFQGYYNRPDLTASVIVDGWYRTGDLGFCQNGELYVVGRKKDLLIIGGENIYPQDIEEIVGSHPAIHDGRAIAIGVYNSDLGTEEIVVVAEVEDETLLAKTGEIEQEIRSQVVAGMGMAVRKIFLKPPKWIVKSTAGKAARSATREKLLHEYPELHTQGASELPNKLLI